MISAYFFISWKPKHNHYERTIKKLRAIVKIIINPKAYSLIALFTCLNINAVIFELTFICYPN